MTDDIIEELTLIANQESLNGHAGEDLYDEVVWR